MLCLFNLIYQLTKMYRLKFKQMISMNMCYVANLMLCKASQIARTLQVKQVIHSDTSMPTPFL